MFKKKDDSYSKLEDGGGLTAGNLDKLNERNEQNRRINDSDGNSADLSQEDKDKGRDDDASTVIDGFKEFDKYGPLF